MRLHELAEAAGLAIDWVDARHQPHRVSDESLGRILEALGYPAGSEMDVTRSLARLAEEKHAPPAFLSVDAGAALDLPPALAAAGRVHLVAEDGTERSLAVEDPTMQLVSEPGYYTLHAGPHEIALAVAPPTCLPIEAVSRKRMWGPAVQIPALRDSRGRAFGNLGHLARTAERFAREGANAIAISPVHALYPGAGDRYSPYGPSSRQFFNTALADPELLGLASLPAAPEPALIDWAAAVPAQSRALVQAFRGLDRRKRDGIDAWASARGEALRRHALFDALYVHFAGQGARAWQDWPAAFHDPAGPAARAFSEENAEAVDFQIFAQWLARQGLERVQSRARAAGMALGTIADLAVGVEGGGSDSWSMGDTLLKGLSIGAPPDPLGPDGQDWGLTTFSPRGLRESAFRPWLEMVRTALGSCGGLRIDHAFGLRRLWVIPQGASAIEGAYLAYPFDDLLRLLALESHRERALVIAEDLGTMPSGFREAISHRAILGMGVLWFERHYDGRFRAPDEYAVTSIAMTGTHDTPTVAGWWRGRDIDWGWRLGRASDTGSRQADEDAREHERDRLWSAIGHDQPRPAPDETPPVVDAAIAHVAASDSPLAIVPLEDLLGLEEQPNLPGTIREHPNWRRRLPRPLGDMLDEPRVAGRLAELNAARSR
ncbi:4-alpha-glucanotransferase [Novosphingobium endophyticum]|uniref:4-alpha-glucanotransferase n=1 Tax=Novosphingobium endophyticum TaxID=1955250 RepID=A0A916TPR3_9SPHN|nr:4-alpha-glucanotransferase [Novosphingobium endophyticum]GGB88348.1 4-alpha-glucanotransferase [Novosphingobium endophyticum]